MTKKKKILIAEEMPEFQKSIENLPEENKIFVDRSLEIANYIFQLMGDKNMRQKDLAEKLGKTEAEISKWLAGMHNYTLRSLAKLEAALGEPIVCTLKHSTHYYYVPVDRVHKSTFENKNNCRNATEGFDQIVWQTHVNPAVIKKTEESTKADILSIAI